MPIQRNTATQADLDAVEPAVMAAFEANRKALLVGDDNDRDAVESFLIGARNILERRLGLAHTEVVDGLAYNNRPALVPATQTEKYFQMEDAIENATTVEELEALYAQMTAQFAEVWQRAHFALRLVKAADAFVERSGAAASPGTLFKNRVALEIFNVS